MSTTENIGTAFFTDLAVAAIRSKMQRRGVVADVAHVRIGSVLDQYAHRVRMADGQMQTGAALGRALANDSGIGLQQFAQHVGISGRTRPKKFSEHHAPSYACCNRFRSSLSIWSMAFKSEPEADSRHRGRVEDDNISAYATSLRETARVALESGLRAGLEPAARLC